MFMTNSIKNCVPVFQSFPQIKLAYFFGSRAKGESGPLSDYDFAVYFDEKDAKKIFNLKTRLLDKLSRLLKTDNVDIVTLDTAESPELKYEIIKDGQLIYEQEPYRVLVEPKILHEYFDFKMMLQKYNLTKD